MIDPEMRVKIRRYFYAEHWKVGTIAQALGVHPDTVKRAIEVERFHRTEQLRSSKLDPMLGSSARRWKPIRVCALPGWSKCFVIVVTGEASEIYAAWWRVCARNSTKRFCGYRSSPVSRRKWTGRRLAR